MNRGDAAPSAFAGWLRSILWAFACFAWVASQSSAAPADEQAQPAASKTDASAAPDALAQPKQPTETAGTPIPPARYLAAIDLAGEVRHVGNGEGYRAAVFVFMTAECPVSREYVPTLNRLAAENADQPVKFYGVISDPNTTRAMAEKFQQEFKIQFPVLFDASGEIADVLGPTHVPEAFVLNADAEVVYRGRIDDLYGEVGKKRLEPTTHELADAIAAVIAGEPVATVAHHASRLPCRASTGRPRSADL